LVVVVNLIFINRQERSVRQAVNGIKRTVDGIKMV